MSLLEGSLARPPFEALSQVVRNSQKIVLKDLTTASATAKALHSALLLQAKSTTSPSPSSVASAEKSVASLIATVTALKRRLEETEKAAWKAGKALAVRLDYLRQIEEREGEEAKAQKGGAAQGRREGEKKERSGGAVKVNKEAQEEEEEDGEGPMSVEEVGNGHRNGHSNGVHPSPTSPSALSLASIPSLTPVPTPSTRLHRILLDYLLRSSYYRTAQALSTHLPHLAPLSDMEAFLSARRVVEGLRARDVSRALAWCGEYRSRLRSVGSSMEFELRVQEMMELVKKGEREAGQEYARKWLGVGVVQGRENGGKEEREEEKEAGAGGGSTPPAASERSQWEDPVVRARMKKLQEAMTAVMFHSLYHPLPASSSGSSSSSSSSSSPLSSLPPLPPSLLPTTSAAHLKYSHYWSDARWAELELQFRLTHLAVHGMHPHSTLALALYIGMATLKTPYCTCTHITPTSSAPSSTSSSSSTAPSSLSNPSLPSSFSPAASCPLCCSRALFELSAGLPTTQRSQSALVCRLSGAVMDEHNPPLVLPNGSMYSRRALQKMAHDHGGLVTCMRTSDKFPLDECKAAFVL